LTLMAAADSLLAAVPTGLAASFVLRVTRLMWVEYLEGNIG
jgi:hypothetical protein